jgi:hypothetical protein
MFVNLIKKTEVGNSQLNWVYGADIVAIENHPHKQPLPSKQVNIPETLGDSM